MSEREKNEKSTVRPMKRTRKKVCAFCADRAEFIDYKDVAKLRKCMTERYKILPRRVTAVSYTHLDVYKRQAVYLAFAGFVTGQILGVDGGFY